MAAPDRALNMLAIRSRAVRWTLFGCLVVFCGCATPAQQFRAHAASEGLLQEELSGQDFRHVLFSHPGTTREPGALHLYLDGDGTPWAAPGQIATDPSARRPLILELVKQDSVPAVLLGRPCYYLTTPDPACIPEVWTMARYSAAVVESLAVVAARVIGRYPEAEVTLIGYSGGGVLAMLLAPRLARVTGVLTVAANFDISAWTTHHDYSPLIGSLNPAEQAPLSRMIHQLHLYGAADRNVPRALSARFFARQPHARAVTIPNFNHECCWSEIWSDLLVRFAARQ